MQDFVVLWSVMTSGKPKVCDMRHLSIDRTRGLIYRKMPPTFRFSVSIALQNPTCFVVVVSPTGIETCTAEKSPYFGIQTSSWVSSSLVSMVFTDGFLSQKQK